MFKNVATKIALFAFDTTTGAAKTGDAGNLTAYVSKDYGAVTVLADTSATEMDATNAQGWYLFDVAQAETNADALLFTGKSSTSDISLVGQYIHTTPNRFSSLVIDAAGLVDANAVKVGPSGAGTAQTAGDIIGDTPTAVENADALLNRDMSTGTDSGSPTVRTPRQAFRFLRNKWTIVGTTLSVKKEDDATESWSSTVTATAGADPITGNDPA